MSGASDTPRARLLIVDDEAAQMQALCHTLEPEGYATSGFTSASAALAALREQPFDLLLTDLMMPEMDGIALLRAAQALDGDIAGILMTGQGTIDTAVKAMQAGALDYILKPFRLNHVLPVLARALETRHLRRLNKVLERRVRERTEELEVANRDLEAFSYSVSHDLRAPLRTISGFCDLFRSDYEASVPEAGRALLQRVWAGAERMNRLIEDLLAFARFSREPLNRAHVSVSALVQQALADLRDANPQRRIEVQVGELPDCLGDRSLLNQVIVNLLSNAFKFTGGRDEGRIEVGSFERDGQHVYFIKDNGVGFDMKYAAKLFGVFQRLHSQQDFAGTGIGLSIVHRIIQRHGGRVWAESRLQEGATFHFSLPISPPDRSLPGFQES